MYVSYIIFSLNYDLFNIIYLLSSNFLSYSFQSIQTLAFGNSMIYIVVA